MMIKNDKNHCSIIIAIKILQITRLGPLTVNKNRSNKTVISGFKIICFKTTNVIGCEIIIEYALFVRNFPKS